MCRIYVYNNNNNMYKILLYMKINLISIYYNIIYKHEGKRSPYNSTGILHPQPGRQHPAVGAADGDD